MALLHDFPWSSGLATVDCGICFGCVFVAVVLYIALRVPNPTPTQWFIFRVILALAAGGIGAVLPGLISVTVSPYIRASGAVALVFLVFWFNPPKLVAGQDDNKQRLKTLDCDSLASLKSGNGSDKTVITFDNQRPTPVNVYWIDTYGKEQSYGQVMAHASYSQETYVGHPWVARDERGSCLGVFLAAWRDSIAEIK